MIMISAGLRRLVLVALAIALVACEGPRLLMPTPNLYADADAPLFGQLNSALTRTQVELIYATDRVPLKDANGRLSYSYERSDSLAVGTAIVDLGEQFSWQDLIRASRARKRIADFKLKLISTSEFARLPPTPFPYTVVDGRIVDDPKAVAAATAAADKLRTEVARRLALTPRKDVFIYIHGYHNTFEDAAFAMAELWHFFGREGLPIIYTWPAGFPGIFGYTYDRESSEFTVYHLKQTISFLARLPEVENIHIIAHSRGTDVAVSAFRELVIRARGAGLSPREHYKIGNFVLAAPDLDLQVVKQRVAAERLGFEADQFTLYSSPDDKAIGFAESIFSSPRGRLGTLDLSELTKAEVGLIKSNESRVTIVNFSGKSDRFGHSYFRTNPAVSSDITLLLRYGLKAGDPGRPLQKLGPGFWRIPAGYPEGAAVPNGG